MFDESMLVNLREMGVSEAQLDMFRSLAAVMQNHRQMVAENFSVHMKMFRAQASVLGALADNEGITQSKLAKQLHIAPPTLTVTLKKMEQNGYIRREADPGGHRRICVYTAEKGRKKQKEMTGVLSTMILSCTEGLTDGECEQMAKLMQKINANILRKTGRQIV